MSGGGNPIRADRDGAVVAVGDEQVALAYDPDAEVWYVRASSVPGLAAQSADREELLAELPLLVRTARLP